MNIPKAIEILSWRGDEGNLYIDQDFYDALKLGVEALKGIVSLRKGYGKALSELLPGETTE